MSNIDKSCVCGKKRGNINSTNWHRHLDHCSQIKTKQSNLSIKSFFSAPKKIKLDEDIISSKFCSTSSGKCVLKVIIKTLEPLDI